MTPYELRFKIFEQAMHLAEVQYQATLLKYNIKHAEVQYQAAYSSVELWNQNNSLHKEYPEFPSYEHIEALADKINIFVSSK